MAPNLTSKSGHMHDSFNSSSSNGTPARPTSLRIKSGVRTDFVVNSLFYHLLDGSGYQERHTNFSALNSSELEVLEAFKKVVNDFNMSYSDRIIDLCSQLEITSENVQGVFLGVLNELFSEGITWARISTFFVFSSELAVQCLRKDLPETVVEEVLDCCLKFVQDYLENWIKDHGGWEGIITFSQGHKKSDSATSSDTPSPGWAKSVLHGTIRMFGTLAHIANSTGQIMALPIHNVRL